MKISFAMLLAPMHSMPIKFSQCRLWYMDGVKKVLDPQLCSYCNETGVVFSRSSLNWVQNWKQRISRGAQHFTGQHI